MDVSIGEGKRLAAAWALFLAASAAWAGSTPVCVGSAQALDAALLDAAGSGGDTTIRVQRGAYALGNSVWADFPFADGARAQQLDADRDGKLDRDERPRLDLAGHTRIAIQCGYDPGCDSRHVDPRNTRFHDFGTADRLGVLVRENAQFEVSGCGFEGGMLWIVHGGRGDFAPDSLDPITGHAAITLERNRFVGSGIAGGTLLIQEEATTLLAPQALANHQWLGEVHFRNTSTPRIRLAQNAFAAEPVNGCVVGIGDRSGSDPEVPGDRIVSGKFTNYGDVHYKDLALDGTIELLHNSIAGQAACGLALSTSDFVWLSNNIIASDTPGRRDLVVASTAGLWSEFNLYESLTQTMPGRPYFSPVSIGDRHDRPDFVDESAGDLRLRFDSPARDRATPASILIEPARDIVDRARIWGSAPDMGAHEFYLEVE